MVSQPTIFIFKIYKGSPVVPYTKGIQAGKVRPLVLWSLTGLKKMVYFKNKNYGMSIHHYQ